MYGSRGFTSHSLDTLQAQLAGWVERGIPRVKMKTSREPLRDPERLDAARKATGDDRCRPGLGIELKDRDAERYRVA